VDAGASGGMFPRRSVGTIHKRSAAHRKSHIIFNQRLVAGIRSLTAFEMTSEKYLFRRAQ
jgi:hypothetical protein